jgi:peptide/nickel transport system permease protein
MTIVGEENANPDGSATVIAATRRGGLRAALRDPAILTPVIVLAVIAIACIAAPLLTPLDPVRSSTTDILAPISPAHPLGGDGVGRDVFARLLYGGRASLTGALIAVLVALVIGAPCGLVAGFYRGRLDAGASWIFNLVMAIPGIVVILVVFVAVGNNVYIAMAVFGILLAPNVFRLVRSSVIAIREELYIDAARVAGLSDGRVISRHILRVAVAPLLIQAAQLFGVAIVVQAGLEFLGFGSASSPSWGAMLNDAFANIYVAPQLLVWPAAAIVITVVMFSLLASAVRDRYQGRGRSNDRPRGALSSDATSPTGSTTPKRPVHREKTGDLLVVDDLRVSYGGREVVSGVSFAVEPGQVVGIVGETGSGKSQTAFSIMGLLPRNATRTSAGIVFDGLDLAAISPKQLNDVRGRRIGYVPQEPMSNLDPAFRIGSQLVEPMRRHLRMGRREAREKAISLLARVGIRDPERVFASYPHELSGGMAQRVLIAGAVSCEPDLIIADEPTTALDVTVQADVLELLRSLQKERRMALLIVTHDFGVVADICDHVIVMQGGKIVESAPVEQLFERPEHPYTASLLASTLVDAPTRDEVGS